jgi:hypothetical protein
LAQSGFKSRPAAAIIAYRRDDLTQNIKSPSSAGTLAGCIGCPSSIAE